MLVQAVQAADVLGDRPTPRDGQGEEQGVEAGVIEALADELPRGDQDGGFGFRKGVELVQGMAQLPPAHAPFQGDDAWDLRREGSGQFFQMLGALREDQRFSSGPDGFQDIPGDELVARGVGDERLVKGVELKT